MQHSSTANRFYPQFRTSILQTHHAHISDNKLEANCTLKDDLLAYQFLVHPQKKNIYAGEQVSPQAPDLQLPLMMHPHDAESFMERLMEEQLLHVAKPVIMQGRLQALDGINWIECEFRANTLPALYLQLYGWHVQAYFKKSSPQEEEGTVGIEVLNILSQLYHAGLWRYYPHEEILEVDSALQKLLNLNKRRLTIQEWLQYIHPDDISRLLKKVFNMQRKRGMFQLNIRYKSDPSRQYRYLTLSAGAYLASDEDVYITGLCFDSTHQQLLQSKNLLNKTFLDQAQALGNIGCFEWMPQINSLQATAQLKRLSGLSKEEDFSLGFLQNSLSAEDFAALQIVYQSLLRGESEQELTIRFRNSSGDVQTLWIHAKATYEQQEMVSLTGIVQDISPLVDKQVQLQAKDRLIGGFLKNLPVCIMAINKKLQIISVIGTGLKQAGLERKNLIGQHLPCLLPEFVAPIQSVLSGQPGSFVVDRNISEQQVVSLFNYFYYDDVREMAIGFTLDISQQKRAELAAQHLNQLEQRYQLMDTFVHAVAHDLRSPVVNLDMLLSFFTSDATPEDQAKYVAAMTNGIQHLKRTLDALIEILRIEKDSTVVAEDIDFKELLTELEHEWGEKLLEAGGTLHTYLQCETIRYNRAYLSSILRNLISNAIKYSYPDRAPHLSICTERKGDIVVLLVQDNGMGMDLKKWGHLLFKPFKRLNNHRKGTGIGLHLIKQMIEKNGGKIKVKSMPGQGTTFFCFLRPYL